MALILNIETTTTMCSVSLAEDGKLLSIKELDSGYSHAENLNLFIEEVLEKASKAISQLSAIAISKGPGSYTGLRIGVSTAKGLCYSLGIPLIAVDTLKYFAKSVAEEVKEDILYCPMIDARRLEVYSGVYSLDNKEIEPVAPRIMEVNSFDELTEDNQLLLFGNGAEKCKSIFQSNEKILFYDGALLSSRHMISIAEMAYVNKVFEDVAYFEPFYLKDFFVNKPKV